MSVEQVSPVGCDRLAGFLSFSAKNSGCGVEFSDDFLTMNMLQLARTWVNLTINIAVQYTDFVEN